MKSLRFRCNSLNESNGSGKPEDFRRSVNFQIIADAPETKDFFGEDIPESGFAINCRTSDSVRQFQPGKDYIMSFTEVERLG